jgi:lipid-A-disaccharide synthase
MVVFMPGSRGFEVTYMLPVFLKVARDIAGEVSALRVFVLRSPYAGEDLLREALATGGRIKEAESLPGELVTLDADARAGGAVRRDGVSHAVRLPDGTLVPVLEGGLERWGEGIDVAVTIPGTNTIQLAYRGIPALVVAALNKPELIPLEGPAGLVKLVPFFGKRIAARAVMAYAGRIPFAALPNIYENEELLPELFGVVETGEITRKLAGLLSGGGLEAVRKRLSRFRRRPNPVDAIVADVWGS